MRNVDVKLVLGSKYIMIWRRFIEKIKEQNSNLNQHMSESKRTNEFRSVKNCISGQEENSDGLSFNSI